MGYDEVSPGCVVNAIHLGRSERRTPSTLTREVRWRLGTHEPENHQTLFRDSHIFSGDWRTVDSALWQVGGNETPLLNEVSLSFNHPKSRIALSFSDRHFQCSVLLLGRDDVAHLVRSRCEYGEA